MKLCGLNIDFPTIEGVSNRQIEYAENLREVYVTKHEERFAEISEMLDRENDYRTKNGFDNGVTSTFFEEFSNEEKACLFGIKAGGIISALRISIELESEE